MTIMKLISWPHAAVPARPAVQCDTRVGVDKDANGCPPPASRAPRLVPANELGKGLNLFQRIMVCIHHAATKADPVSINFARLLVGFVQASL